MLLTADLGYMALEPFSDRFPDRFFNVGVAEQNMAGLATGLAEAGYIPFIYSIATFVTLRPYEFLRNGPIQHKLPVRIVGVGGGVEYATNGLSHYSLEDLAVMRAQPGLKIIVPADAAHLKSALLCSWHYDGPIYYRLGKDEKKLIPALAGQFEPKGVQILRAGSDILFLAVGPIVGEVLIAADLLNAEGISAAVVLVSVISPPPLGELAAVIRNYKHALSIEVHYATGGLGSLVCEAVAEFGLVCKVTRLGVPWELVGKVGSQSFLENKFGLSGAKISATVSSIFRETHFQTTLID